MSYAAKSNRDEDGAAKFADPLFDADLDDVDLDDSVNGGGGGGDIHCSNVL